MGGIDTIAGEGFWRAQRRDKFFVTDPKFLGWSFHLNRESIKPKSPPQ